MGAKAAFVVAWLSAGGAAADKTCTVEGKHADAMILDVASRGGPTLRVRVRDLPVVAHPPDKAGGATRVEVRGALAFEGTAAWGKLPFKPNRFVEASNGMVRLAPGTETLAVRTRGKWAAADVTLGEVTFHELFLPCDSLTLDPVARAELEPAAEREDEGWVPAGKRIVLRTGPGDGPSLEVELGGDSAALELSRGERRGAWARVSSHWLDGTTLTGWAKQSELRRPPPRRHDLGEFFPPQPACARDPAAVAGTRLVQATLAPGTPILADRLFPWATARGGDPVTVRLRANDSWAEIVSAAGVAAAAGECPEHSTVLDEAWVPQRAIKLPSPDGGAPR